jgi:cytidylate kinase
VKAVTRVAEANAQRIVTVDGPAGSGKSTLGRRLASALGVPFIDTGLFYRAATVAAARQHVDADDEAGLAGLVSRLRIEVATDPAAPADARIDGARAGAAELHDPELSGLLSAVSRNPAVREALLPAQRALAGDGAVAAGRDCGTVVFPLARLKIYLEADEDVRTERRATQLRSRGEAVDVALLDAEVRARDAADSSRRAAPLQRAPDSMVIDTGAHGIDEMVAIALRWCRERGLTPLAAS